MTKLSKRSSTARRVDKRDRSNARHRELKVSLGILAKNEQSQVTRFLRAIAEQTLVSRGDVQLSLFVIANGCTDSTAEVAQRVGEEVLEPLDVQMTVANWPQGGKSRSWNRLVHDVIPDEIDHIIMMDCDIEFVSSSTLENLLDMLLANPGAEILSGYPVKRSMLKTRKNLIDRFSLSLSHAARPTGCVNGSLYISRSATLKNIWLPDATPGEDGFLNAMVTTCGFSRALRPGLVRQMPSPTHYFEDHSVSGYFVHERRMIVGTMVNRWMFEYFHSLQLSEPAGPIIDELNRVQPDWVDRIITARNRSRWLIPRALLFRRLRSRDSGAAGYLLRLPIFLAATLLTLLPAVMANRALKRHGAALLW